MELGTTPIVAPELAETSAPNACSVSGIPRFAQGIVGGPVTVALFPLRDGQPEWHPADRTTVAAGERYCLRSTVAGPHALVAVARSGHQPTDELLRPANALVDLVAGTEVEVEPLELGWGEAFEGRVVRPEATPVTMALVEATLQDGRPAPSVDHRLRWVDERFELARVEGRFSAGAFLIRGLAASRYAVTARPLPAGFRTASIPTIAVEVDPPSQEHVASASGIVLSTGEPLPVHFRVSAAGRPLPADITVTWSTESGSSGSGARANEEGLCDLVLDPARRYSLVVSHLEHLPRHLVYEPQTLVPGSTVDVELESGPASASLVIVLSGSTADALADHPVDLWIYPEKEIPRPSRFGAGTVMWGSFDSGEDTVRLVNQPSQPKLVRDGPRLSIDAIPPGRYLVRVVPRVAEGTALPDSLWLEESLEIELAPGERAERLVEIALGGRVRLDVRGEPSIGSVELELEGPGIDQLQLMWRYEETGSIGGSAPRVPGISHLAPPLQPGPWSVRAHSRQSTLRTFEFTVVTGTTTDVVIDLTGL